MRIARALLPAALLVLTACASERSDSGGDPAPAAVTAAPSSTAAAPTEPSMTRPSTTAPKTTAPETTAPTTTGARTTTAHKTTPPAKTTPPVKPAEPALAADVRSLCPTTAIACVNIDAKVAWLQRDGEVSYGPVPITTGMPGYDTPRGTFWVLRKHVEHVSSIYGTPMPYSVFFTDYGIAFHQGSLQQQSHGCVHLDWDAAETFYNALDYGAEIVVA